MSDSSTMAGPAASREGLQLLQAVGRLPGGAELLALVGEREDAMLVGGAVRDLLLGRGPRELDVSVGEGPEALAAQLAEVLAGRSAGDERPPEPTLHPRFRTALLSWGGGRADFAARRTETYPYPGALPEVTAGSLEQDLARRDFTVNTIALQLGGPGRGRLRSFPGALEDLREGRLRVLHPLSFSDDPTRLLRLARYSSRLGFAVEPGTLALAQAALDEGALETVSAERLAAELRLLAREGDPAVFARLGELGISAALGITAPFDLELARAALELAPPDADPSQLQLAVLARGAIGPDGDPSAAERLAGRLATGGEERAAVLAGALEGDRLALALSATPSPSPSAIHRLLAGRPLTAVIIAAALAARAGAGAGAAEWLSSLRHVGLRIDGRDLLAAGVPEGPEVGHRLDRTLGLRLDGLLGDEAAEQLRSALEEEA